MMPPHSNMQKLPLLCRPRVQRQIVAIMAKRRVAVGKAVEVYLVAAVAAAAAAMAEMAA
jgi:hypothetical protein